MRLRPESRRHGWLVGAVALLAVGALGIIAFRLAVRTLERELASALGPTSEIGALRVRGSSVVIEDLRIPGPAGWPAPDALRAERVAVVPSLRSLVSGDVYRIRSVSITRPYFSALHTARGVEVALPGASAEPAASQGGPSAARTVAIGEIAVEDGVLELFDATVQKPPLRVRIERIEAQIDDVSMPDLNGRTSFAIDGIVKGAAPDGTAHVEGWAELATRSSSIRARLRGIDLVPLAPYLIQSGEAGVRAGRIDLDLVSEVRDGRIRAPGKLTLTGLELEPGRGVVPTFMGMSRRAMLASLKEKGDRITVDFTIEGDLENPAFSLNGALGKQLALSLASSLGLGVVGLAEGVGTLGLEGTEAAGQAVKGVGGALWNLLERKPEK